MASRGRKVAIPEAIPENDASEAEMLNYNFDAFSAEGKEIEDFEIEEGEVEAEEGEDPVVKGKATKRMDDELGWYVFSDQSDDDEKYGAAFREEEVGEREEEIPLSPAVSAEKFEEEVRQVEESDHVLAEIPAEVTADREAIINRIKELQSEQTDLRQRNRLLELWVTRFMKKTQQRMTPADITKDPEKMERTYKEALRVYKMQVDEILTQRSELKYDLQNYELRVRQARDENERTFDEFLEREKEVAVGLVYEKTGRKITDKIMDVLTHRQMVRTKVLARGRRGYIFLQHVLEDLMARLRFAETLGEGMTTMDYEVLHVANIGYKDRLDERNQELEKLRIKIAETVNGVAQYKEKEVCLLEDIDYEERRLADYREANTRARERVNQLHLMLNETRDQFNEKKVEAGLLVAREALLDMERKMKLKNSITEDIAKLEQEIESFKSAKEVLQSKSKL